MVAPFIISICRGLFIFVLLPLSRGLCADGFMKGLGRFLGKSLAFKGSFSNPAIKALNYFLITSLFKYIITASIIFKLILLLKR